MSSKQDTHIGIFENRAECFQQFTGVQLASSKLAEFDCAGKHIAIIGTDQFTVSQLDRLTQQAQSVKVFQISPQFILPCSTRSLQRMFHHPLISKNRRLFNNRVKSILSLRYLENQVANVWLRRQLMPNLATPPKVYLKSDDYYVALQRENCQLITWPILKIAGNVLYCINGDQHQVEVIVHTYLPEHNAQ
ncbi:flavoprotein [Acinetobacter bohemicus]|uniref:flavoprotein n=1 Tax=Acinetobacter sp. S4397-1 TaxID=2972915 RepID=UPI00209BA90F|nr:flavoprotein [Acinetobacter sp. S4397-1]MCO8044175.1 flavoprotein [Acinetobacter sp. S4397-1]